MALEMDRGYSLPLQFSNPAGAKSINLHGAGLRVANAGGEPLSALVVAHNASQTEMTVSGRLPYTMKDGSSGETYVPQLKLLKGETSVIDVTRLLKIQGVRRNDVASAGLEFHYTGELGSLITAAFSVSDGGDQVFRVPLWDIAAQRSATGGYPWYIEGRSSTVVYIKNVTDQPGQFRMYLMYPSDSYLYPLTTVAPGQTITVDIRALRDNQIPDMNGKTIPSTETRGQVQWSMTGGQDLVLIGRSEQADLVKGISSNYSCVNCCGNSFYDGWLTPDESSGSVGGQMQFVAMQRDANCYGQPFNAFAPFGAAFSGTDPSICDPDSGGLATGIAPGQAGIYGNWSADGWIAWDIMGAITCEYSPVDVLRDALCEVVQCASPMVTVENSAVAGVNTDNPPLSFTQTKFLQTLGVGDYVGRRVQETAGASANQDDCWNQTSGQSPYDPASLSGGSWPVVTGNQWGWDAVGYRSDLVDWYREIGPIVGVTIPCTATVYQAMEIECNASFFFRYETNNVLTSTIYANHVENCRYPMLGQSACHTINR
jgi:hypothetical protein